MRILANRSWLTPAASIVLLVGGTVAVTSAIVLAATDDSPRAAAPGSAPSLSPSPTTSVPSVSGNDQDPAQAQVSELADPAWVRRSAALTDIPEAALASYAGASIALARTVPACGVGWNTLAAIGLVESRHVDQTAEKVLVTARALCASGGDLSQPAVWTAAVTARVTDPALVDRVTKAAAAYVAKVDGPSSSPTH